MATLFAERVDDDFRLAITPVLEIYARYLDAIVNLLYKQPNALAEVNKVRLEMDSD